MSKIFNLCESKEMMQKLFLYVLLLSVIAGSSMAQSKINQRDAQGRKQGHWIEEVGELRGEPGYSWEGDYRNDRKEGHWKKTSAIGNLLAEETFKNNVLEGYCKYYFPDGKLSEEGAYMATEIDGQRDTIMIIDPVTNVETPTVIIRKGNSVRNGVWKLYDEETGKMLKTYYKRGETVTAEELGDTDTTTTAPSPAAKASFQLPHAGSGKQKKKG
ncbi:toxin-antitoxin system YwqK family antitoxin [Chitinophaga sp. 30R24]|uniref:toxin-antitoxin system YwqK family antitoxin n=1 Tax=Chitinophaga sp. 30R24 TaxID=3248838 RepID=UPI003B906204